MSLTVQQARDLQQVCTWVAGLTLWEHTDSAAAEPGVADALVRLAKDASGRLWPTGQDRGPTHLAMALAPSVQWMRGEQASTGGERS